MLASIYRNRIVKNSLVMLLPLSLVSMVDFSSTVEEKNREIRLDVVARMTGAYTQALKIDGARTQALNKIRGIIGTYNRTLDRQTANKVAEAIYEMSIKYDNLDIDLICATITHESALTWDPEVVSPVGALGLMQIMPRTGRALSKHEGVEWTTAERVLFNPIDNVRMGCRYLSMLIELYNVDGGLAAYNGGATRAAMWLASGRNDEVLFEETRGYIPAVLKLYHTYRN